MASESGSVVEVAALGRPFNIGMLYDCRKDVLVPGITLWDHENLQKYIRERPQNYNNFKIDVSETFTGKYQTLDVGGSLKLSVLSGMVEAEGSAKYLNDNKKSRNQARVTLEYKATTKIQELFMNHLGEVKHQSVFESGVATHVVTSILYGADAFFVFDRQVSKDENVQDIQGNLKIAIKKIPKVSIEGEGSLKINNKEIESAEKFSCTFYGDFCLPENPLTFQDAIKLYQELPKLLGPNGENSVPVKVWMLPLTCLDSAAAKLERQISSGLVQEAQRVLEDLIELEMRCNDALRTTAGKFPQVSRKLKDFKEMCSDFKLEFQSDLAEKLPLIRGGQEEKVLVDILKRRRSSPFSSKNLNQWMDHKETEIAILNSFITMMKPTKIISSEKQLYEEALNAEQAVCFGFPSLGYEEPYLSALSRYLESGVQDSQRIDIKKEQWYTWTGVLDIMKKNAKLFSDFAEDNKKKKNMKFLAVSLPDETEQDSAIYCYQNLVREPFEPPPKPETVTAADIKHDSVTLKISPPTFGAENIISYSVEYSVSGEDEWKQKTAPKPGEVTVSDLRPNTDYEFRCRAVTREGVGPACDVTDPIRTSFGENRDDHAPADEDDYDDDI